MTGQPPLKPEEPHIEEQEFYHGDKIVATLRLRDPGEEPPEGAKNRRIQGGPLFDLPALQRLVREGTLDLSNDAHCYVATNDCWDDLRKLRWSTGREFKEVFLLLRPKTDTSKGDFYRSEWCMDSDGYWNASDAYRIRVDQFDNWKRDVNAPLYYIKFSILPTGELCLVLISCHLDESK